MKIRGKNVLESYLSLLEVKYTESFTEQYFNEHPYKFSYGIDNGATQIPDKEQNLSEIGIPFIAQFGGDFVAVYKVEPDFKEHKKNEKLSLLKKAALISSLCLLLLINLSSCGSHRETKDEVLRIDIRKAENGNVNASEVISDIEYVALETSSQCLI